MDPVALKTNTVVEVLFDHGLREALLLRSPSILHSKFTPTRSSSIGVLSGNRNEFKKIYLKHIKIKSIQKQECIYKKIDDKRI